MVGRWVEDLLAGLTPHCAVGSGQIATVSGAVTWTTPRGDIVARPGWRLIYGTWGGVVNGEDQRRFREFVAARTPALMRTAYLLAGNQHDAEDLLQTDRKSVV